MKKLFNLVLIMAWLSGWSARKEIAVPAVTTEQTDINVEVTITYDSAMKSDFADIRFTDSDGGTELYHYRCTYTASTEAVFMVKVPVIPVAGKSIYLYFGNASAESASDGPNTFPLFSDFADWAGVDSAKWTETTPGMVTQQAGYVRWSGYNRGLTSNTAFGAYYGFVMRVAKTSNGGSYLRVAFGNKTYNYLMGYVDSQGSSVYHRWDVIGETSVDAPDMGLSEWVYIRTERTSPTRTRFWYNWEFDYDFAHPTHSHTVERALWLYHGSTAYPSVTTSIDIAYVYKLPQDGTVIGSLTPSSVTTYAGKLWRATKLAYQPNGEDWGTASVPGENDEVKAVSFGPLLQVQDVIPDPCSGWVFHSYFIMARKSVRPELKIPLRYSGRFWSFVAQLMGSDEVSGSDPYTHLMTLIESIDGANLYGTLAASFGTVATGVVEWPSVKPTGFSISGPDDGGFMTLLVRGLGDRIGIDGDAVTTYANMTAVTHIQQSSALPLRVPFGGMRLRMNDQTGSALSASDYMKVKKVDFAFERMFGQEFCSRGLQSRQWETDEPIENGIPDTKMTLLLPDMEMSKLKAHADGTQKKADLYFQLSADYDVLIEMPLLQPIPTAVNKEGQGRLSHEIAFAVGRAVANPTGMAFSDWRLTLRDGWETSYIATT